MTDFGASVVVGTAGHIDHGKTSLVRTLTGIDLDSQPEERQRGITISLGFTPLDLSDGRRIAMVDVPGHERLVRTMVAGATGIDAVLLCVSAVDGVMPQTREHLAILELLGVTNGVVALTMVDLVDEEMAELAAEDVQDLLQGTFLQDKPVIPFSAVDLRGKSELLEALATFERPIREEEGVFRVPVDRSFVRPGFGTVVTGTVWSGQVADGDQVQLLPMNLPARVRGIQVHGEQVSVAHTGWRVALNLAGVDKSDVSRGVTVARGEVPLSSMVDVQYRHIASAPMLEDGASVRFLLGTAECLGRIYFAEDWDELPPGAVTWAQIRLETPIPCMPNDRFVIRRATPITTLGGGVVVDPWAPKMRARDRVKWGQQIRRLHEGQVRVWLERAGGHGLTKKEWSARCNRKDVGILLDDRIRFAASVVARLEGVLLESLEHFHRETPLSLGAHRRELRRGRLGHLPERVFDAIVERLDQVDSVVLEGSLVRLRGFQVQLNPHQQAIQKRIFTTLQTAGVSGITLKKLCERHKEEEVVALLYLLERSDQVRDVANLGWVCVDALEGLRGKIRRWFTLQEGMTPGDFKELTGFSRKVAIPLLEWLDETGVTRRERDHRVPGKALSD